MSAGASGTLADAAMAALDRGDPIRGHLLARRAVAAAQDSDSTADDDPAGQVARVAAWRALGTAQRMLGRFSDAQRSFRLALELLVALSTGASLEIASLHNDIGMTCKLRGRFADAAEAYAAAGAILCDIPDADPEDIASLWHNLGGLAHARGDYQAAEPLARRGIEVRTAALGPDHVATLLDRSAYAAILDGLGRSDEAAEEIRHVLRGLVSALGDDHPEVSVARNNLAAILQQQGDLAEAERLYREVIAAREARLGSGSPALASALSNLGTVLRARGLPDDARAMYERALRTLDGAVDDNHPSVIAIRRNLARVMPRSPGLKSGRPR